MADNTEQFDWITLIVGNLKHLLREQAAFVAGDLLWYPVEVEPPEKPPAQAPDAMVAFGRPKGKRGSYQQWEEGGVAPQVVFEILSPRNTRKEMAQKQRFYERYGVLEMYYYDPQRKDFWGYVRETPDEVCTLITALYLPWVSPLLHIRFELPNELVIFHPDGEPFAELDEVTQERDQARAERDAAQAERDEAQAERDEAQAERDEAQAERDAARVERDRFAAKLRALGIDPHDLTQD